MMLLSQNMGNGLGSSHTMGGDGTLGSSHTMGGDGTLGSSWTMGGDGTIGQPPIDFMGLNQFGQPSTSIWPTVWGVAALASAGASAYHGYKRNNSVGWGVVWGLLGSLFPVITPAVALAQGFGKAK